MFILGNTAQLKRRLLVQAPIALPRCFAEILCPDFGFGSLREFRPRCRSFTVIHQVLPQNCASSVRKIYSQITLVQLCGIALTPVSLYFLVWRRPETGDRFENRERQRFFLPHGRALRAMYLRIRKVRYRTATQVGCSPQARHKVNCLKGKRGSPGGYSCRAIRRYGDGGQHLRR